jgi:hypothetical protein
MYQGATANGDSKNSDDQLPKHKLKVIACACLVVDG